MADCPKNTVVGRIQNGFLARMMNYSPPAIVVWLALANRADETGGCRPSIGTLQADTGLSRATIFRAINRLVNGNEITVTPGGGRGNPANQYYITGSMGNELVQEMNQFKSETKVVQNRDSGSLRNELKPNTRTTHKNQTAEPSAEKSSHRNPYPPEYERFWLAVAPHKRDKKAEGFRRYKEAVKEISRREDVADAHAFLLGKVTAYYTSPVGQTQYCNGPAPWLHQGGYDADPASWQRHDSRGVVASKPSEPLKYRG